MVIMSPYGKHVMKMCLERVEEEKKEIPEADLKNYFFGDLKMQSTGIRHVFFCQFESDFKAFNRRLHDKVSSMPTLSSKEEEDGFWQRFDEAETNVLKAALENTASLTPARYIESARTNQGWSERKAHVGGAEK